MLFLGLVLGNFPRNCRGQFGQDAGGLLDRFFAQFNQVSPTGSRDERTEFKELVLSDRSNDDSYDDSTREVIEQAGFKSVTHTFTSSDGYVTELIQVINPLADQSKLKRPPVMLFHAAITDTTSYVWGSIRQHHPEKYPRNFREDGPISSSNRSLALMLANNGYDVWLVASRGSNRWNIGHVHYKTRLLEDLLLELWRKLKDKHVTMILETLKYFDFTQDALVEIEYPQQIDEVLRLTQSRRVSVVTFAKASQIMFKLLASDPLHANRIHSHVTMSPCLNLHGSNYVWKVLASVFSTVPEPIGNLLFTQIATSTWTRRLISALPRYSWQYYLSTLLSGPSPLYQTFLEPAAAGRMLMPISFKEFKHYLQQVQAGKLQKFDYGPIHNRFIYNGSATPPEYDVRNIKLKRWMMISAENDVVGTPSSAQEYYDLLPHRPAKWIQLKRANHIDHIASVDNDVRVNLPILSFMDKYRILPIAPRSADW